MVKKAKSENLRIALLKDLYQQYSKRASLGKPDYITFNRLEKRTDYGALDVDIKNEYKAKEAAYEELHEKGYAEIHRYPTEYRIKITEKGKEFLSEQR